jgi:hypothetical protein
MSVLAAKLRLAFCRFSLAASVPGGRCRVITHPGVTLRPGPRSHRILQSGNGVRTPSEVALADLAIVAVLIFRWGTVSARLERFDVTAPITFVLAGLLLTHGR